MAVPALPASTVLVLRDGASAGLDVYLVQRPQGSAFMAGAHVFPGGRVEGEDRDPEWATRCDEPADVRSLAPGADEKEARAHGVAAVRELFEEVGLLLARSGPQRDVAGDREAPARAGPRQSLIAGGGSFLAVCRDAGWRPALDLLVPLSRWVTPEPERRRFDTRFFVARLPAGQAPAPDGREAVAGEWIGPAEAVARHLSGRITLAPPTLRTLEDLSDQPSVAAALAAGAAGPYRTISPRLLVEAGTRWLLLPGDELYPALRDCALPPPTRFVFEGGRWRSWRE